MRLKDDVRIYGARPEILVAMIIVDGVFQRNYMPDAFTITSVAEGKHSRGSLHYVGMAFDFRFPPHGLTKILADMRQDLGPDFDVVQEKTHIHVEFQPKEGY